MPVKIDLKAIEKGIALIERATESPLVRGALLALLPKFGLTAEQIAQLDTNHDDYLARKQKAQARAKA